MASRQLLDSDTSPSHMLAGLTIKPGRRVEVLARTLETVDEKVRGGLSIAQQTPWRVDGK